ncbi:hypothetical protein QFC21_001591, partial [Naganishia friedmannii]
LVQAQASVRKHALQAAQCKASSAPTRSTYLRTNDGLYQSLAAVLKHLRQDVTALSLAFSGKSITVDAALAQLTKVTDHVGRLVACVIALPVEGCLIQEWRQDVTEIADRIDKYFKALVAHCDNPVDQQASSSTSNPPPAPYLLQTSSVWAAVDKMIRFASKDEPSAIKKSWKQDQELVNDAMGEFRDLLEDDEGVGEEEGLNEDNEWAELEKELNGGGDLSEGEMQRVRKLDTVVRLIVALHKRFLTRFLDIPELLALPEQLNLSHSISESFDASVASLYPPQNTRELRDAAQSMIDDATRMCRLSLEQAELAQKSEGSNLVEKLKGLQVTEGKEGEKPFENDVEWLTCWLEQIEKASRTWKGEDA